MSSFDTKVVPDQERREEVAAALRVEWRMIAAVTLWPCPDGDGLEAEVRLDPVVVKGSLEQQGYPTTPAALAAAESRRYAAVEDCVRSLNGRLQSSEQIRGFSIS